MNVAILGGHVAGGEDVGKEEHLLVGYVVRNFEAPNIGEWHASVLRLAASVASHHVGIAEQARARVAIHFFGNPRVRIGVVAARPQLLLAEPAAPACDGEWHQNAVARIQVLHLGAEFDDLAHELVAEDVALLHRGNVAVVEMKIRAADGGGGDLNNGVTRVQDLGVRDIFNANVAASPPAKCFHKSSRRIGSSGDRVIGRSECD